MTSCLQQNTSAIWRTQCVIEIQLNSFNYKAIHPNISLIINPKAQKLGNKIKRPIQGGHICIHRCNTYLSVSTILMAMNFKHLVSFSVHWHYYMNILYKYFFCISKIVFPAKTTIAINNSTYTMTLIQNCSCCSPHSELLWLFVLLIHWCKALDAFSSLCCSTADSLDISIWL